MPKLTYSSKNFKAPYTTSTSALSGRNTIDVPWKELIWAAVTAGKPDVLALLQHGLYSRYERLMRLHMLRVNWKESASVQFEHTEVFKTLDPSEKTAISYFMGLTIAKFLSGRFLKVPWLQHYDVYLKKQTPPIPATGVRPDLVGLDTKLDWIVMEAKGRSGIASKGLMKIAKNQLKLPPTVSGKIPVIRVASASYANKSGVLFARWEDPDETDKNAPSPIIEPLDFLEIYYAPIRNLIDSDAPGTEIIDYGSYNFTARYFPDLDVKIGLLNEQDNFFLEKPNWHFKYMLEVAMELGNETSEVYDRRGFVGPDGVFVELGSSWDSENMQKEPSQRASR